MTSISWWGAWLLYLGLAALLLEVLLARFPFFRIGKYNLPVHRLRRDLFSWFVLLLIVGGALILFDFAPKEETRSERIGPPQTDGQSGPGANPVQFLMPLSWLGLGIFLAGMAIAVNAKSWQVRTAGLLLAGIGVGRLAITGVENLKLTLFEELKAGLDINLEARPEFRRVLRIRGFQTGKSDLPSITAQDTEKLKAALEKRPPVLILVGNADRRGLRYGLANDFGSNLGLARRRAEAVHGWLKKDFGQSLQEAEVLILTNGPEVTVGPHSVEDMAADRSVEIWHVTVKSPQNPIRWKLGTSTARRNEPTNSGGFSSGGGSSW